MDSLKQYESPVIAEEIIEMNNNICDGSGESSTDGSVPGSIPGSGGEGELQ